MRFQEYSSGKTNRSKFKLAKIIYSENFSGTMTSDT